MCSSDLIVIDERGVVLAGNATIEAAGRAGIERVHVVDADGESLVAVRRTGLTQAQKTRLALYDNRTAELADWDSEVIADMLATEREVLDGLFENYELEEIVEEAIQPVQSDAEPMFDQAAELLQKWKVEAGDLWLVGEHRLLCGDSTSAADVARLMAGASVDAVVTDPPYGIDFSYDKHDDDRAGWFDLMNRIIPQLRKMAPFVVMPSCGIDRLGWWYANHAPDWLMCWYKGSPGHLSKVGFNDWESHLVWGRPPKQMHDYWQTKCGFEVEGHPCPKPLEYAAWLVERAVEKSGLLFDPFLGSGTTMVAAQNLQRKCYGIEISPAYCAVILESMQAAFPDIKIERAS